MLTIRCPIHREFTVEVPAKRYNLGLERHQCKEIGESYYFCGRCRGKVPKYETSKVGGTLIHAAQGCRGPVTFVELPCNKVLKP